MRALPLDEYARLGANERPGDPVARVLAGGGLSLRLRSDQGVRFGRRIAACAELGRVVDPVEELFCARLQHEGIGTLYERIVKGRMLRQLAATYGYTSVLEYGCQVTKGFDNLAFLHEGLHVTVADADIESIRRGWRFPQQPDFTTLDRAPKADLVWSFAYAQLDPSIIDRLIQLSNKHVLVFVPNVFNPGAPAHFTFHLLTRTPCKHAERGKPGLRTRRGLVAQLARRRLRVLSSGYIDAPPIPNIAFSIRELKEVMGKQKPNESVAAPVADQRDPARMWRSMQALTRFESNPAVSRLKPVVAHHIYALGAVK